MTIFSKCQNFRACQITKHEGLYFTKDRLLSWEGVQAYPGVITPAEGQNPLDPMTKLEKPDEES